MNRLLIMSCCFVFCLGAACDRRAGTPGGSPEEALPATAEEASIFRPDSARESLPRARIYYTLTDYEWYARGQPLLHEGRPYQPAGPPVAASMAEMTLTGEYERVEYYTRSRDPLMALYVPVFEGYWLPFRTDTTRAVSAESTSQ